MPVVSMRRITAAGPMSAHDGVLHALQRLGAVQVEDLASRSDTGLVPTRNDVALREVAGEIARLSAVLEMARKVRPRKKPMFTLKRRIAQTEVDAVEGRERELWAAVDTFERNTERIAADKGRLARLRAMGDLLRPWSDVAMDLTDEGTARVVPDPAFLAMASGAVGVNGRPMRDTRISFRPNAKDIRVSAMTANEVSECDPRRRLRCRIPPSGCGPSGSRRGPT